METIYIFLTHHIITLTIMNNLYKKGIASDQSSYSDLTLVDSTIAFKSLAFGSHTALSLPSEQNQDSPSEKFLFWVFLIPLGRLVF